MKNPFKDCVKVEPATVEAYFNMPLKDRTMKKWYWFGLWYKSPLALQCKYALSLAREDEWHKFKKQIKKEYPIQYFVRNISSELDFLRRIYWFFNKNIYWPIYYIFKPQNRHLIKHIPRKYKDPAIIIQDIMFEAFTFAVETTLDCPLEHANNPDLTPEWNEVYRKEAEENKKIYDFIKIESPALIKKIDELWDESMKFDGDSPEAIEIYRDKILPLDEELNRKTEEILHLIIKNRHKLD